MAEYCMKYKCRLCKQNFINGITSNQSIVISETANLILDLPSQNTNAPTIISMHFCEDGGVGIADFLGFGVGQDEDNN